MPQTVSISDYFVPGSQSGGPTALHSTVAILLMRMEQNYPRQTAQARKALGKLQLAIVQSTWTEVAWSVSSLTPNGFPLEFSFSSTEQAIRYTTEIAGPEVSADKRLKLATELVYDLTDQHMDAKMYQCLCNIQQSGKLDYGAWVSGRHGVSGERYKIYVEVPTGNPHAEQEFVKDQLDIEWILSERATPLRMIGVDPASGRTELYFKAGHLEFHQLYKLLALTGDRFRAELLIDFIQKECQWSDKARIPGSHCGFSYSVFGDDSPPVFSLFFSARRFWGGDENICLSLFRLVECGQLNLDTYVSFMTDRYNTNTLRIQHTLITLTILPDNQMELTIGLIPLVV